MRWLDRAIAGSKQAASAARVRALEGMGRLTQYQGDTQRAEATYEAMLELSRRLDDKANIATALNSLGTLAVEEGDNERAKSLLEENLAVLRELNDEGDAATTLERYYTLNLLGMLAINEEDDYSRGAALWEAGLALAREGGGMNSVESSAGARLPRAGGCLLRGSTGCKPAGRDKTDCHQHLGGDGRSGRGREEGHPSGALVGGCGSGARGHRRCFATPRADAARAPPGFGSFPAWGDDMRRRSGRGTSYVTRSGR